MVPVAAETAAQTFFCYGAMTMLTVPEEFLLLTLKDEEGGFVDIPLEYQRAGFVGAAVVGYALPLAHGAARVNPFAALRPDAST